MLHTETDFRKVLARELEGRRQLTPSYSLRSFAKELGLAPSRLSEILSGKQGMSADRARSVSIRLALTDREREFFCDLVESEHARSRVARDQAKKRVDRHRLDSSFHTLNIDLFQAVAAWHHFAIINLIRLKDFEPKPSWIAKTLGIQEYQASEALERLTRLKLIRRTHDGGIEPVHDSVATADGVPSEAIRAFHRSMLAQAAEAIHAQPLEERDLSSSFLAIDPKRLPEAKRWLKAFRRRFVKKLERDPEPSEVYCLGLQFFRLSRKRSQP